MNVTAWILAGLGAAKIVNVYIGLWPILPPFTLEGNALLGFIMLSTACVIFAIHDSRR